MARFDVHLLPSGELALDRQSDRLEHLVSRFTVPLVPEDEVTAGIAILHPTLEVRGERLVMATHLSGAVATGRLAPPSRPSRRTKTKSSVRSIC